MGGQKYVPPLDKETEAELQKAKAAENAQWRTSQFYGNVLNDGNSTGRIITSLPRMFVWR